MLGYYLSVSGQSVPKQSVIDLLLPAAELAVERWTRRHFSPDPPLRSDYTRQVVSVMGLAQTNVLQLSGQLGLGYGASYFTPLPLPITAAQLQAALRALPGLAQVTCDGGPLPSYPVSVYMVGTAPTTSGSSAQLLDWASDPALLPGGTVVITDMGLDSSPPVARYFTTRGRSELRVPDLRAVDAGADPRVPGSGGVRLYGRRLLPNQYFSGYGSYAQGGSDQAIGSGSDAEPATELVLGYGYGMGLTLAQQFAFVLPQMYLANDCEITGRWGWSPTPADVVEATYVWAARAYRERDAAFSDSVITPEGAQFTFFRALSPRVQQVLSAYRVPHIALV